MELFWIVAIVIAVALVLMIASKKTERGQRRALYMPRETLFTAAERSFLGVLDQATAGRYRVFGKVRVADVLTPIKGLDRGTWQKAFNRISAKHFDFVFCDPRTLEIRAVIELNDRSHKRGRRVERDELIGRACADAGLPLRMVKAQRNYSVEDVKQTVDEIELEIRAGAGDSAPEGSN